VKQPLNILLVDDSPIIISRVRQVLDELSFIGFVHDAKDAEEAFGRLQSNTPHLVLLDIIMPGKSGIALLADIKELYPSVEVIMLSNNSTDDYRNKCLKLGAVQFVDKTTEFEQLPGILEQFYASWEK